MSIALGGTPSHRKNKIAERSPKPLYRFTGIMPKKENPDNWREFLRSTEWPYVEFKYAPDHLKTEFLKWKEQAN